MKPPHEATASLVALLSCSREIRSPDDCASLQCDLDHIYNCYSEWRMVLNKSTCGVLSITRNKNIVSSTYQLQNVDVEITESQKDLGVFVTTTLKWNQHMQFVTAKASKMLSFIRRSNFDTQGLSVRRSLYLAFVRRPLAYCFQF